MPPPEGPQPQAPAENRETPQWIEFRQEVAAFNRALGPRPPLPENATDLQLQGLLNESRNRVTITSFNELNRGREILFRSTATRHNADLQDPANRNRFNRESYIVSAQAATYCQDLSEITGFVSDSMRNYELVQDLIVTLPQAKRTQLEAKRAQSVLFLRALRAATAERVAFANARNAYLMLAAEQAKPEGQRDAARIAQITARRDEAIALLSPASRAVLVLNPTPEQLNAIRTQATTLERKIIGIAAGTERVPGVDAGWIPTYLYLDVLEARYTQIQDEQKAIIRDNRQLEEGGGRAMEILNREREAVMGQMVAYTQDLSSYQLRMAQLNSTQNIFTRWNVEDAQPSPGPTPPEVRADINRSVIAQRDFHLGRVEAVTTQANVEFRGGILSREQLRDALMNQVVTAANISSWIARIITLGGRVDIGNRMQGFLAGPICEALQWPKNPDGTYKTQLTQAEADAISTRLGRLNQLVQDFNRNNNGAQIRDTVAAIKAIDPTEAVSNERVGQVREPLPAGPIAAAQVPAKLAELQQQYGNREDAVTTLQAVLLRQLNGQWGTLNADSKSGTGFIGQYAIMLTEIERMIGVQLDVAGACFQMQANMFEAARNILAAVGTSPITRWAASTTAGLALLTRTGRRALWATATAPIRGGYALARYEAREISRATPFQRAGWGAGMAVEAYATYQSYQDIQQEHVRLNDVKSQIAAQLVLTGFRAVPEAEKTPAERQAGGDVYAHACGSRIRLSELNMNLDQQRYAAYARFGTRALGLGSMMLMGPRIAMGPAGWALIAIQVTVEAGINSWQNQAARRLIASPNTPPWLLAALGTSRLVNQSEYDMLLNSSSWNFLFGSTDEEKKTVREKTYFTIFNQELGAASPELLREITAGTRNIQEIDAIFSGDFKSMLLPYLYVRLFQKARARNSGISWDAVKDGKMDRGMVVIPPDITNLEIREAMRELGVLYVQHLREKRFIDLLARRRTQEAEVAAAPADQQKRERLADTNHLIALMGNELVLGQPLSTLTPEQITANNGKTRAQILMETIYGQVNGNPGAPNFRLNQAAVANIQGLPAAFANGVDFSNSDAILGAAVTDPAQLVNLRRIAPLTTDEPEGRVYPAWNDWGGNLRRLLEMPTGSDAADTVHGARLAANNAARGAGLEPVADNASFDAARDRITEAGIKLFDRNGRRFTRDNRLGGELYRGTGASPLVFSSINAMYAGNVTRQRSLMEMARLPSVQGGGAAFDIKNVKAVFIETETLPSGHDIVLFTFVFGDVQAIGLRNTRVYVVQQAAASSATGRSENRVTGRAVGYNEAGFRQQRGANTMFDQTVSALQQDAFERQRAAHETAEREARERPAREAAANAARLREQQEAAARAERIRLAMERVRANPNTFVSVENANGNGSRFVMRYTDNGEDKIVSIAPYNQDRGARFEAAPSGVMKDPEHNAQILVDGVAMNIPYNFMRDLNTSWARARLYLRILTTAHPGESEMPFERIISMMPHYDTLRYDVRSNLRDLYNQAADKQGFLYHLLMVAGGRGGFTRATVINPLIGSNDNVIVRHFRDNKSMFDTAGRAGDMDKLSQGLGLMGNDQPNEDGIWWIKKDANATPIGYRFIFGQGWQWTPHQSGTRHWMNVDTETVRAGSYRGRSPVQANLDFIRSLPR